jgi:hypothetical protein
MKCPHCGKRIPDKVVSEEAGRIGGREIAKRGPEYFRQLQARRKIRGGGRPRKDAESVS